MGIILLVMMACVSTLQQELHAMLHSALEKNKEVIRFCDRTAHPASSGDIVVLYFFGLWDGT